jgi:hypothetical protein
VAPERARYGTSSREADLWSLGATLYAAVEGRTPYGRESVLETLSALAMDPPDPMRLAGPLEPVIAGLLQRDPARRTHPDHLAEQLQAVIAGGMPLGSMPFELPQPRLPSASSPRLPVATSPRLRAVTTPTAPPAPPHKRGRTVLAGAGALTLVAVVGLIIMANNRGESTGGDGSSSPSAARSALACENTPTAAAAIPVVPPPGDGYTLPKGWAWYTEKDFVVAVPDQWTYWKSGTIVCFRDLYGSRTMGVVPGRIPAETLNEYHLISRENIDVGGPATEWEFTFSGLERKRHAIALVTPGPTLLWITDDFEFSTNRALYDLAKASFKPGHGDRPPPRGGGPGEGQPPPKP